MYRYYCHSIVIEYFEYNYIDSQKRIILICLSLSDLKIKMN